MKIGYLATTSSKDVNFTHGATGFFGARTFRDLLSQVSVVGASVRIR